MDHLYDDEEMCWTKESNQISAEFRSLIEPLVKKYICKYNYVELSELLGSELKMCCIIEHFDEAKRRGK